MFKKYVITALLILSFGCGEKVNDKGSKEYINSINTWHQKRENNLKKENGWLNLVGLYWLNEGENTIGSDPSNMIEFPEKAPKFIGKIILKDGNTKLIANAIAELKINGNIVREFDLLNDNSDNKSVVEMGDFRWFIIKRDNKYGIRVKDLKAPLLSEFTHIDRWPVNEDWKIKAKFLKYDEPKPIEIPTAIGTIEKDFAPGKIVFNINGKDFSLEPTSAGDDFFIVFADMTNGEESYGAGRFLYTDGPDSLMNVTLDFNKAYNPPCAFTKYATCPYPTKDNQLRLRIEAGEKNYGHGH